MLTVDYSTALEKKINYATKYNSKPYFMAALKKVSLVNPENAEIIRDYIVAEQNQMNIKESTKEGKMKGRSFLCLLLLTVHFRCNGFQAPRNTFSSF